MGKKISPKNAVVCIFNNSTKNIALPVDVMLVNILL